MSTPSTPRTSRRKSSVSSSKKATKTQTKISLDKRKRFEETGNGPEEKLNKKGNHWTKTEEVLTHLALVGLGDSIPDQIQQGVRQKVLASRRALQRRADVMEVIKPLQDLADFINDHGYRTGRLMNDQLVGIRTVMEQATLEKFEDRATETSKSTHAKDIKGMDMKRKLEQAKFVLSQLSDLNELKIILKNAVETILKVNGYFPEDQAKKSLTDANTPKVGALEAENLGVKEQTLEITNRIQNWKKIDGVLDHLMRVCQRPSIATELQQIMMTKISASRKLLELKVDPLKISKPLHKLIDLLNDHCLESSEAVKIHLDEMQNSNQSESKMESGETSSMAGDPTGADVRKMLGQARACLNYLSEINQLKMIIKKSADLIQRGGVYKGEELKYLLTAIDEEEKLDVFAVIRDLDKANLSPTVKTMVKVTLTRVADILVTTGGKEYLGKHLLHLKDSLNSKNPEQVSVACSALIVATTEYDRTRGRRKMLKR